MKKIFKLCFYTIISMLIFTNISALAATTGTVTATAGLILRKGAGTTYSKVTTISYLKEVTINSEKATDDGSTGCSSKKWYNITYSSYTGYVCSSYIEKNSNSTDDVTSSEMAKMTDKEFEEYLEKQGFPTSYWVKLKAL